ncbi:hypothetical protein CCO03_11690 [Comamonas serinivorans]|uniref:Heme biosynthesis operon protein HemX n=1 Tax=Comamonas serinivorans TaxID=1082851 RepID=A0A1Y0EPR8_9BURK|nr:uroporphyrinogen-III C-methyltransferase [Comamonas serinivorans]ARU05252.1 hypothetical protein CCO03_11690 [Comamonas serinivorans]
MSAPASPESGLPASSARPDPSLEITMLDHDEPEHGSSAGSKGDAALITPSAAAGTAAAPGRNIWVLWTVSALVLAGASLLASLLLWQRLSTVQEQLARQNLDAGNQSVEARTLARQAQEQAAEAGTRVSQLEGRVSELATQRAQIDALLHAASRSADDSLVADLEASLRMAQEQTQLTGSASPLLAALQSAQRRVAASTVPNAARIQRALTGDIARIKAMPTTDTAVVLARLDEMTRRIDHLPTLHDARQSAGQASGAEDAVTADSWLSQGLARFWQQIRSLVRVSVIESPEAALLTPEQTDNLRAALKQRLQGARMGMLARQPEAVRGDLTAVAELLRRYFDPGARQTQASLATIEQLRDEVLQWGTPRIDDSLAALAAASGSP